MNFKKINKKIETNELILRPVDSSDQRFINEMFKDKEVRYFYIVPKEAQQDYKMLLDYWINDMQNGAGTCWIIIQKINGILLQNRNVGFIAFEFRETIKNARISYAILPKYRRKGIATQALSLVIDKLKQEGVEKVEADIDQDNFVSERVVEKLEFKTNKSQALVDPEMLRDGEIRIRALWKKDLVEINEEIKDGKVPLDARLEQVVPLINKIVEEINTKGQNPPLLARYYYLLGRIKFLESNYEEAKQAFGQSNMIIMNKGLPEIHENYYWIAKIIEAKGEKGNAKLYYGFALENYNENPNYISKEEIEREMNK
ncbi:MAG: GNAT family N-acetyltransferase [bacterium]